MRIPRLLATGSLISAAAMLAATGTALADPSDGPAADPAGTAPRTVQTSFSPQEIEVMADSSGRTVPQQVAHLDAQEQQNNAYATLHAQGNEYDGAYFDAENVLVVQADAGSPEAVAAQDAGLEVRTPDRGAAALSTVSDDVSASFLDEPGIVSIAVDLEADAVVVTVTDEAAASGVDDAVQSVDPSVTVRTGAPLTVQASFTGGDKVSFNEAGTSWCSAGFPAHDEAGTKFMLWAGHCVEPLVDGTPVRAGGAIVGDTGKTAFTSFDGQPDRDLGVVQLTEGTSLTDDVNDYESKDLDASKGTWKAPVGTDLCKSGATTGITCGQVTGYDTSVRYTDPASGRIQAEVSGLGTSSVCTEGGDSGGAYVSGGYAVGLTSGGPADQSCGGFNAGYVDGASSLFQPVDDVLEEYGLTYGE